MSQQSSIAPRAPSRAVVRRSDHPRAQVLSWHAAAQARRAPWPPRLAQAAGRPCGGHAAAAAASAKRACSTAYRRRARPRPLVRRFDTQRARPPRFGATPATVSRRSQSSCAARGSDRAGPAPVARRRPRPRRSSPRPRSGPPLRRARLGRPARKTAAPPPRRVLRRGRVSTAISACDPPARGGARLTPAASTISRLEARRARRAVHRGARSPRARRRRAAPRAEALIGGGAPRRGRGPEAQANLKNFEARGERVMDRRRIAIIVAVAALNVCVCGWSLNLPQRTSRAALATCIFAVNSAVAHSSVSRSPPRQSRARNRHAAHAPWPPPAPR